MVGKSCDVNEHELEGFFLSLKGVNTEEQDLKWGSESIQRFICPALERYHAMTGFLPRDTSAHGGAEWGFLQLWPGTLVEHISSCSMLSSSTDSHFQ